jgi:hypothetical protein
MLQGTLAQTDDADANWSGQGDPFISCQTCKFGLYQRMCQTITSHSRQGGADLAIFAT